MTKEYDERKASGGKHCMSSRLLKALHIFVVVGCVLLAAAFILMLLFPAYNGADGWLGFLPRTDARP